MLLYQPIGHPTGYIVPSNKWRPGFNAAPQERCAAASHCRGLLGFISRLRYIIIIDNGVDTIKIKTFSYWYTNEMLYPIKTRVFSKPHIM